MMSEDEAEQLRCFGAGGSNLRMTGDGAASLASIWHSCSSPHADRRKLDQTCKGKKFQHVWGLLALAPNLLHNAACERGIRVLPRGRARVGSPAMVLEMSQEGTWYGLAAWIEPHENKDTRGGAGACQSTQHCALGQHLITNKIYFFMPRHLMAEHACMHGEHLP